MSTHEREIVSSLSKLSPEQREKVGIHLERLGKAISETSGKFPSAKVILLPPAWRWQVKIGRIRISWMKNPRPKREVV